MATLNDGPGVYRMLDAKGAALYVGKARSLRKRVAAYTKYSGHSNRIQRMISATATMEFISTQTETDALLLEANLIKRLKPRYNVLLRDDKSFPHILIEDGPWPLMRKHRGARREKGRYFGPFASAGAVNRTLNTRCRRPFLLALLLATAVFENRTRPCLQYQIKRCCRSLASGKVGRPRNTWRLVGDDDATSSPAVRAGRCKSALSERA